MPGPVGNAPPISPSSPATRLPLIQTSRQAVIAMGLQSLQTMGTDSICAVCIANGGSCCTGCRYLAEGVGCQRRNTGCTAWLCGFLKYFMYETGQLRQWNRFWEAVPGKDFRQDSTPDFVSVKEPLNVPAIGNLSKALAADLRELAETQPEKYYILSLREKLDRYLETFETENLPEIKKTRIKRKINLLSKPFQRFHQELRNYRQLTEDDSR